MSAMREELHHLVDELPEAEIRPVLELVRGRAAAAHGGRDLPFFASFVYCDAMQRNTIGA